MNTKNSTVKYLHGEVLNLFSQLWVCSGWCYWVSVLWMIRILPCYKCEQNHPAWLPAPWKYQLSSLPIAPIQQLGCVPYFYLLWFVMAFLLMGQTVWEPFLCPWASCSRDYPDFSCQGVPWENQLGHDRGISAVWCLMDPKHLAKKWTNGQLVPRTAVKIWLLWDSGGEEGTRALSWVAARGLQTSCCSIREWLRLKWCLEVIWCLSSLLKQGPLEQITQAHDSIWRKNIVFP